MVTVSRNIFQYMKYCPVDLKPLGQTKVCPDHGKSKFTFVLTISIPLKSIFVDPGMA